MKVLIILLALALNTSSYADNNDIEEKVEKKLPCSGIGYLHNLYYVEEQISLGKLIALEMKHLDEKRNEKEDTNTVYDIIVAESLHGYWAAGHKIMDELFLENCGTNPSKNYKEEEFPL
jgi:hypothetical protein